MSKSIFHDTGELQFPVLDNSFQLTELPRAEQQKVSIANPFDLQDEATWSNNFFECIKKSKEKDASLLFVGLLLTDPKNVLFEYFCEENSDSLERLVKIHLDGEFVDSGVTTLVSEEVALGHYEYYIKKRALGVLSFLVEQLQVRVDIAKMESQVVLSNPMQLEPVPISLAGGVVTRLYTILDSLHDDTIVEEEIVQISAHNQLRHFLCLWLLVYALSTKKEKVIARKELEDSL